MVTQFWTLMECQRRTTKTEKDEIAGLTRNDEKRKNKTEDMKKVLFALLALLTTVSCVKDDTTTTSTDGVVQFTTSNSVTRSVENKSGWATGDAIGIYAKNSTGVLKSTNVEYTASVAESVATFSPAGDDKVYYTSHTENSSFVAYYPHNEDNSDENVAIKLDTDQDDLLVSGTVTQGSGDVTLTFSHVLAMMQIEISGSDYITSFDDLRVFIAGSHTRGVYDIFATGNNFTYDTTDGHIEMTIATDENNVTTATALVMPSDYSSTNVTIYFEVDGKAFYKVINPKWDSGWIYNYSAKVGYDYIELTALDIEKWNTEVEDTSSSSEVDIIYKGGEYCIYTAKGLAAFRDLVNGSANSTATYWGFENDTTNGDSDDGVTFGTSYLGINGKLMNDIDLSVLGETTNWIPIGRFYQKAYEYSGTFNGNGHKISGLYINSSSQSALFGYVASSGVVYNLGVSGNVTGSHIESVVNQIAGIVANNYGFVVNCYSEVNVTGGSDSYAGNNVGGIVGCNYSTGNVVNCYNRGDIKGTTNVGGIVGYNKNEYDDDDNVGEDGPGGYVGYCCSTGSITGTERFGGVVGYNLATSDDDVKVKGSFCLDNTTYSIGQVKYDSDSGGITGNVCTAEYLK